MQKAIPGWQNATEGQWREACRREAVIWPLAEQEKVSRAAAIAAAEELSGLPHAAGPGPTVRCAGGLASAGRSGRRRQRYDRVKPSSLQPSWPLEVVQIDHTLIDVSANGLAMIPMLLNRVAAVPRILSAGARQSAFYLFDWRSLQIDFLSNFWMYVF